MMWTVTAKLRLNAILAKSSHTEYINFLKSENPLGVLMESLGHVASHRLHQNVDNLGVLKTR